MHHDLESSALGQNGHRHAHGTPEAKPVYQILRLGPRPLRYLRLGEASHPGPVIRMPGDGHCLYHSLGWWTGQGQAQVRAKLAAVSAELWRDIAPWDGGQELERYQQETRNPQVWGALSRSLFVRPCTPRP